MTPRGVAWRFVILFWTVFGVLTGFQVWISMITHGHSVPRLIFYYVVVWEAWVGATAVIVWLLHRFPVVPARRLPILVHFLAACCIAIVHSFYWVGLMILIRPYDRMTAEASQLDIAEILFYRLPLEWLLYCLVLGAALAFEFYERYRERALQAAQLETSLAEARLHALELQIQPHFLFNTLNAISGLVRSKRNDEAVTMMAGLSELLRYTLDHAGDQHVTLDEELSVLRRYLEIQRARFPDRMSFTIEASGEAGRGSVPALLLQPLAENAVRHGIALSASPGVVNVRAFRNNGQLRIEVFNSGALGVRSDSGIGLRNTTARLRHLYGDEGRFDLAGVDGGVTATVTIPWAEAS
ncbi:MAG TPA: histidine kinase [Thermoanaerobaculia bacterium]|jgi:two-component system LytT family sensor kinase|nr:histidine kinase [Thermoanaerobaculia bacterium]